MKEFRKWPTAAAPLAVLAFAAAALAHEGHHGTISAGKLARDASKYYGRTVTVSAEVEDVLDEHSFTLDEDALFAGPDVLVLLPQGRARTLRHDEKVKVTGTVRPYVVADLDRDFEWFDEGHLVRREVEVDYKTRPVLVATQVMSADGRDLLAATP